MSLSTAYAALANVYVNLNRKAGCRYVYSYVPSYSREKKRTLKKDIRCIGKILAEGGEGEVLFNGRFLAAHPEFAMLRAVRTGRDSFRIEERREAGDAEGAPLLQARKMKIGASYFISEAFKRSYSGRALKAMEAAGRISRTQARQLATMLIYAVSEGMGQLPAIEYFVRDHVVPCRGNFDKDTIQRLFASLDDSFIIGFYRRKQEIMQADLSKKGGSMQERRYVALDGTNIDTSARAISSADFGKSKSGAGIPMVNFLSLIDQEDGTLLGHCTYPGHTSDIATLEGAVRQLAFYGCRKYTLIADRGYWSVYNACVMCNMGIDFICHVRISHGIIRKFVNGIIGRLSRGSGCAIIRHGSEINYGASFQKQWGYWDARAKAKKRKPIWLYAYYNPDLAEKASLELAEEAASLNAVYASYRRELAKAAEQHRKKPEMPSPTARQAQLIEQKLLVLNTKENCWDVGSGEEADLCLRSQGVWLLASTRKMDCGEMLCRYRQRNEIEAMCRYFKNSACAAVMNVSAERSFTAKLFVGLLASEFMNSVRLRAMRWNASAPQSAKVEFKDNSLSLSLKDLDTLECLVDGDTIIPVTNILKRHENLFAMMGIDPVVLQNIRLKKATLDDDMGLQPD